MGHSDVNAEHRSHTSYESYRSYKSHEPTSAPLTFDPEKC